MLGEEDEEATTSSTSLKDLIQRLRDHSGSRDLCLYPYVSVQSSKELRMAKIGNRSLKRHTQSFSGFGERQGHHFLSKLHVLRRFYQTQRNLSGEVTKFHRKRSFDKGDLDDDDAGIYEMCLADDDFSDDYERFDLDTIYGHEYRPSATSGVVSDSSDNDHPSSSREQRGHQTFQSSFSTGCQETTTNTITSNVLLLREETSASSLNYSDSSSISNAPPVVTLPPSLLNDGEQELTATKTERCSTVISKCQKLARFLQHRHTKQRLSKERVLQENTPAATTFHHIQITIQDEEGNLQPYEDAYDIHSKSPVLPGAENVFDEDGEADEEDEDDYSGNKSQPLFRNKNTTKKSSCRNREKTNRRSPIKEFLGEVWRRMQSGFSWSWQKPAAQRLRGDHQIDI